MKYENRGMLRYTMSVDVVDQIFLQKKKKSSIFFSGQSSKGRVGGQG